GAVRDMIIFSAGISLFLAGVSEDILGGVKMASKSIDSGAAGETLRTWALISNTETPSTECM
ncbi:MAG: anthranilate phosphoribosyltransferase, partial [Phycisphaerales bacterium]